MPKRYSAKLKCQIVIELIQGEKTAGEVAKAYGVHPNSASVWRRQFMEKAPEVFTEDNTIQEYEKRIAELEELLEKKELEIALSPAPRASASLIDFLGPDQMNTTEKARLVEIVEEQYGLEMALSAVQLPKSTWYYH